MLDENFYCICSYRLKPMPLKLSISYGYAFKAMHKCSAHHILIIMIAKLTYICLPSLATQSQILDCLLILVD